MCILTTCDVEQVNAWIFINHVIYTQYETKLPNNNKNINF